MRPHQSKSGQTTVTTLQLESLLQRHHCPTPLPVMRALLLGHIASPRLTVSPLSAFVQAWGGELSEFASRQEVDELMSVLTQGLWNTSSDHQSARHPFRLHRSDVRPDRQGLRILASLRAQELQAYTDGLFGPDEELVWPERAHEALAVLADLHSMFDGAAVLLEDESKPAPAPALKALLHNHQKLTIAADARINKVVQAGKAWRGQQLDSPSSVLVRTR